MRPTVTVRGVPLPEPAIDGYNCTTSTFVDAARNLEGVTIGDVVRENVSKIEITWKFLTAKQWSDILALFDSSRGGAFYNPVTFHLQDINSWVTKQMYVSDRTASVFMRNPNGSIRGYEGVRLALIEV